MGKEILVKEEEEAKKKGEEAKKKQEETKKEGEVFKRPFVFDKKKPISCAKTLVSPTLFKYLMLVIQIEYVVTSSETLI